MGMSITEKRKIEKILKLVKAGEVREAYELLKEVLVENPENVAAWEILLRISTSEKERKFAQFKLDQLKKALPSDAEPRRAEKPKQEKAAAKPQPVAVPGPGEGVGGEIRQAMALMKTGKNRKARNIVRHVLKEKPNFPPALYATGLLAETRKEHTTVLKRLAAVSEKNPEAKPYYQKLAARKFVEKKRDRTPIWLMVGGGAFFLVLIGLAAIIPMVSNILGNIEEDPSVVSVEEMTCEELIAQAMSVSDRDCRGIGTNQVCYGNDQLISEFNGSPEAFDMTGDILGIEMLQSLKASPLDLIEQLWGVAVFKLNANMPGTVPGQNVTFLAFGNTEIDNDSGDMTAFYFSTGFGGITCNGVDFDGLKIEMPDGAGIEFVANDVEISLQGDAIMVAQPGGEMGITVVNGQATVTSNGVTRTLVPGTSVSIPISSTMNATGAPSAVTQVTGPQATLVCQMYGVGCPPGTSSIALGGSPTPTLNATSVAVLPPTETPIGFVAGDTLTPTNTPIGFVASDTPIPTKTNTPKPPTNTPIGFVASDTPTPTKTNTPTVTNTPKPGSTTAAPTTAVPTTAVPTTAVPTTAVPTTAVPTTAVPIDTPTNTPVPDACADISISLTNLVKFKVNNKTGGTILLTSLKIQSWPATSNGNLKSVVFNSNNLNNLNLPAPANINVGSGWTVPTGITDLVLGFVDGENSGAYRLIVSFDNGCDIDKTYNK